MWSSALVDGGDTIVARATAAGRGALAMVRLTGGGAFPCVATACPAFDPGTAWRVQRLELRDAAGEVVDRVLVVAFPGPRSSTGEDVVELTCHGSSYLVRRVVEVLVSAGARVARPGEFTRRAVANGKLDLVQAEALRDLIAAETALQARSARLQLEGRLSARLRDLRGELIQLQARLEGGIDLAGQGVEVAADEIGTLVERSRRRIDDLLATAAAGERLRHGARVAIVGPPNAGKSTLFNLLVGFDRAIVSAEPGTTRDAVEARVDLAGLPITLVDTAGERAGGGAIEQEGMRHARREAAEADLIVRLWPADGDPDPPPADERELKVRSKSDLAPNREVPAGWIAMSVVAGEGAAAVRREIERRLRGDEGDDEGVVIGARHRRCLERCRAALDEARPDLPEIAAQCVREALEAVRETVGEVTTEEVLDSVFATFCVGK